MYFIASTRYRVIVTNPRRPEEARWTPVRIAGLRAALALSQSAFAAELGVRQQTVSEWETGQYQPRGASARMLRHLAEDSETYDASPTHQK